MCNFVFGALHRRSFAMTNIWTFVRRLRKRSNHKVHPHHGITQSQYSSIPPYSTWLFMLTAVWTCYRRTWANATGGSRNGRRISRRHDGGKIFPDPTYTTRKRLSCLVSGVFISSISTQGYILRACCLFVFARVYPYPQILPKVGRIHNLSEN